MADHLLSFPGVLLLHPSKCSFLHIYSILYREREREIFCSFLGLARQSLQPSCQYAWEKEMYLCMYVMYYLCVCVFALARVCACARACVFAPACVELTICLAPHMAD
ncbi:hypothetical protein M6B38_270425 [Iris pallida]|uniref:Uncharacterized protein n=1 Tax=Iris pallida TaxID=29817 RepID=A0AAX6I7V2_IRIPA|nr:hypothetical protein M6B38_270425 [Iris pallida]